MCSSVFCFPRMAMISNGPGDALSPVSATRSGQRSTPLSFTPYRACSGAGISPPIKYGFLKLRDCHCRIEYGLHSL